MNKIELTEEKNLNNQKTGIFYLLISAVLFSFVGIFVKGVEASSWDVIYWRALFGVIFVVIWYGFRLQLGKQLRLRMSGISIALLAVICTTAFLSSFKVHFNCQCGYDLCRDAFDVRVFGLGDIARAHIEARPDCQYFCYHWSRSRSQWLCRTNQYLWRWPRHCNGRHVGSHHSALSKISGYAFGGS